MPTYHSVANLDAIGEGFPAHELAITDVGPGGAMGALRSGNFGRLAPVLQQLGHAGWAAVDWGEGDTDGLAATAPGAWSRIRREGEALWPLMEAGMVRKADGTSVSGVSPSGSRRGDRFVTTFDERLSVEPGAWATLRTLHEKLQAFGFALGQQMRSLTLTGNSDSLFACFPGGGAHYGAHYDGGVGDPRRLTCILYLNEGWREADGGALMLFDEAARCWRSVLPRAGRLVVFRSDRVLHRVAPAHAQRYALTMFFYGEYRAGQQ